MGIVSWNCADELRRCLTTLPAALAGLNSEVVVVDNASTDDSATVADSFPTVSVMRNDRNVGYAQGMNRALRGSAAPVLVALNPDTAPAPGSIAALVRELTTHPEVGVVAPLLRNEDGSIQHSIHCFPRPGLSLASVLPPAWRRQSWRDERWLSGAVRPGRSGSVDWATGAVHVIRRDALAGQDPYRERWFMYVEDLDLCWRLRERGWATWFASEVDVIHIGNRSGAQAFAQERTARWMAETYDWYREIHGSMRLRLYASVNLVAQASAWMLRRANRRRSAVRALLQMHLRTVILGARPPAPPIE